MRNEWPETEGVGGTHCSVGGALEVQATNGRRTEPLYVHSLSRTIAGPLKTTVTQEDALIKLEDSKVVSVNQPPTGGRGR